MQEKKFKVRALSEMNDFEKDSEYWVYSVATESDRIKFLMYSEIEKSWSFYDSSLFHPVKEKSAEELLIEFQTSMNKL